MLLLPPISTRPDTLFPNTTLFRSDVVRVVTALAADDHVHRAQRVDAVCVLQRRRVLAGDFRAGAASARRAEEMRFDQRKVVFLLHPLHQHRTDHAAPTDQTYLLHVSLTPWEWRARSGVHRDENQKTEPAEKRADRRVDAETHIAELDLQNRGLGVDARQQDRKSTRLNYSHYCATRMQSSA